MFTLWQVMLPVSGVGGLVAPEGGSVQHEQGGKHQPGSGKLSCQMRDRPGGAGSCGGPGPGYRMQLEAGDRTLGPWHQGGREVRMVGKGQSLPVSLFFQLQPCLHQVLWLPSPTHQSLPKKDPSSTARSLWLHFAQPPFSVPVQLLLIVIPPSTLGSCLDALASLVPGPSTCT